MASLGILKSLFLNKTAAFVLVSALVGFFLGAYVVNTINDAARAEALSDALKEKKAAIKRIIDQQEAIRQADSEVVFAKDQVITKIVQQEVQIPTEVIKYVPAENDLACSLTVGAVGMLNRARSAGMSTGTDTTGFTDAESGATSTVTQRAEVAAHADCAIRYNKLKTRHNALIDWLDQTHQISINP